MSFTVYKSSAGSGKTFAIVKEYLTLVIQQPSKYRRILAITFTNKAANEMKERILQFLQDLASVEQNRDSKAVQILLPTLISDTGLTEQQISYRAHIVISGILHNYSDFGVGTIDSFVHKIIRTFAHDLKLPVNFEVELDEEVIREHVIEKIFSTVGVKEELTKILLQFIVSKTNDERSWSPEADIKDFVHYLLKEDGLFQIQKLKNLEPADFFLISRKVETLFRNTGQALKLAGLAVMQEINNSGLSEKDFYQGKRGVPGYFDKLSKENFSSLVPNSYVVKALEEDKWTAAKTSVGASASIDQIKPFIIQKIKEVKQSAAKYFLYGIIRKNIYPIALLKEIEEYISEIRDHQNLVHISEFNKRISEIVSNQPIPFIYERLGEKYQHFLIDEFQDTSQLQWQNLLPLVENSLSNSNFNMIVGDGKQAIYRWRSGEVEQFARLPMVEGSDSDELIKARQNSLIHYYNEVQLQHNYRSSKDIVEFNNHFFEFTKGYLSDELKGIFEGHEQIYHDSTTGYVNIRFVQAKNAIESVEKNIAYTLETISNLKKEGCNYGDIAILCRSNRDGAVIASELLQNDISVISSESLLLGSSEQLQFLMAVISLVGGRGTVMDFVTAVSYLDRNLKGLIPDLHFFITPYIKDKRGEAFMNRKEIQSFFDFLNDNGLSLSIVEVQKYPVYELLEEVVRVFDLNEKPDAFLATLLDTVLDGMNSKFLSIPDLIQWWNEKGKTKSVPAPEGVDAVRIMTIHKSKGLEFPVVILPFAKERLKLTNSKMWTDLEIAEIPELQAMLVNLNKNFEGTQYEDLFLLEQNKSVLDLINVWYVAMTRPTQRMYIFPDTPSKSNSTVSIPNMVKAFLQNKGLWKDDCSDYEFGACSEPVHGDEVKDENNLQKFIASDWREKVVLAHEAGNFMPFDDESEIKWGTIVHSVLSNINTIDDLDGIMINLAQGGALEDAALKEMRELLDRLLNDPDVSTFFLPELKVKTEAGVLMPDGKIYRPDRIVYYPDGRIAVIDYKTGKKDEKHIKQLNQYGSVLSDMGYDKIDKYLIYIGESPEVIPVFN